MDLSHRVPAQAKLSMDDDVRVRALEALADGHEGDAPKARRTLEAAANANTTPGQDGLRGRAHVALALAQWLHGLARRGTHEGASASIRGERAIIFLSRRVDGCGLDRARARNTHPRRSDVESPLLLPAQASASSRAPRRPSRSPRPPTRGRPTSASSRRSTRPCGRRWTCARPSSSSARSCRATRRGTGGDSASPRGASNRPPSRPRSGPPRAMRARTDARRIDRATTERPSARARGASKAAIGPRGPLVPRYHAGRLGDAELDARKASVIAPDMGKAWLVLGLVKDAAKDEEAAAGTFARALAILNAPDGAARGWFNFTATRVVSEMRLTPEGNASTLGVRPER